MKIIILQDFLRSGGTERQSILLANAFATTGHATTLLTFRPGGALARTLASDVQHRALQPFDLALDWFAPGLTRSAAALAPDVVLCMGRMANCYGATLQNHLPHTAVVATMRTGKKLPPLFRRSLTTVRHIVANSRGARETLISAYAIPPEKISVIHNALVFPETTGPATARAETATPAVPGSGIVPSTFSTDRSAALRAQHNATPSTTIFLCVAMFRPEKNQRELIEIVADLPRDRDWQLWLAGDGPARAACEQLVATRNLASHVRFLGFHRDPSPLYRAADIAVHASWSEALSNFLIEAQAHGLPAVAYSAQGIDECFLPERTGWVIARNDREAFRRALASLMTAPPAARAALSTAARDYARVTFDPTRNIQAYLDLFARLK